MRDSDGHGQNNNDNDAEMKNHQSLLSGNTSSSPNKRAVSMEAQRILEQQKRELNDDQRKELEDKMKQLKLTSRWLSDSALTTYFGKPAFHPYGHANTKPANGGSIYGQYMKTFNINPHSGGNKPEYSQIHGRTLLGGTVQVRAPGSRSPKKVPIPMTRKPIPPRVALLNNDEFCQQFTTYDLKKSKRMTEADKIMQSKTRGSNIPITFEECNAQELIILPPTFTEKNLKTKKVKIEKQLIIGRLHQQSQAITNKPSHPQVGSFIADSANNTGGIKTQTSSKAKNIQLENIHELDKSGVIKSFSERNSLHSDKDDKSQRVGNLVSNSHQSHMSGHRVNPASKRDVQKIPFCEIHGGAETTANEFLHLLDPKNYKFLPAKYT